MSYLVWCPDKFWFLFISFASQVMGGIGAGFNVVSSMSLLIQYSKKADREKNIGQWEMCSGLGLLVGPLFGSAFYSIGGYAFPFMAMGIVYAVMVPIIAIGLRIAKEEREKASQVTQTSISVLEHRYAPVKKRELFKTPRFTFALFSQSILASTF